MHNWLKQACIAFVPGPQSSPLVKTFIDLLLDQFRALGHVVQELPDDHTDILLTTAPFGKSISWRKALLFTGRVQFKYRHSPAVYTLIHITPDELKSQLAYFQRALGKEKPDPSDYSLPGLASEAYKVLYEQGRRGGPILAFERLLQAQSKCINILLLVGDKEIHEVYHFDLVGAYPATVAKGNPGFLQEIVLRMVTRVSTREVTDHLVVGEPISRKAWAAAKTPAYMLEAARNLDKRHFFTDTVHIYELVNVPAVGDAVASQYSEGCFTSWDPDLNALIATVTGSARPVAKGNIVEDDLAVIVGVRPDGAGALVRMVEGKRNDPPSSEAVEMVGVDSILPRIVLNLDGGPGVEVPVIRSKLHGHRGIASYNPELVEFVSMDPPYYDYPVTCATEAQARGVISAFSRSQALQNPEDPRKVVFTILPTHGVLIAEKWVKGSVPFQTIWEYFDQGHLVLDNHVPQGPVQFIEKAGQQVLTDLARDGKFA
jgi:hypothetical protein